LSASTQQSLRDCPTLEAAFAAYERERRGRVERVVAYSARVGRSKIAGPWRDGSATS